MPKSRQRGGKKAHNKRIEKRSATIKKAQESFKRQFLQMLNEKNLKQQQENMATPDVVENLEIDESLLDLGLENTEVTDNISEVQNEKTQD